MKSTGIVRKVDELGRVVLPIELRRALQIKMKDPLEIYVEEEKIILQKYEAENECLITREVTDQNVELIEGLILSPKGMEILKAELDKHI